MTSHRRSQHSATVLTPPCITPLLLVQAASPRALEIPTDVPIPVLSPSAIGTSSPSPPSSHAAEATSVSPTSVVSAAPAPPVHGPIPTPLLKPKEAVVWHRLIVRYTEERLLKHQWKWIPESECWLPVYEYATMKKLTDIWAEHVKGLNGHLLSEAIRRNKVVDLVRQLSKKPNGDVALALKFLCKHYEHLTSRAFTNLLGWNKNQGFTDILKAAEAYP
ncbi:hypothetical protein FPV67DRAFT_1677605 [Lyophyllum atratum]|nr:hypothetical protein FPV67DRAFT_1677605 [Lyophyllum atratum]